MCMNSGIAHSADGRVQQALRKRRPECWAACGDQADNVTALCPVSCLFETMLGNHSAVPIPYPAPSSERSGAFSTR